jgi:TonB family protein
MFFILMGVAVKTSAILAAAWLIAFLLRRRSAAARHLVWTAALVAVLTLPVLTVCLPALHVPVANEFLATSSNILFQAIGSARPDLPAQTAHTSSQASAPVPSTQWRPDWKNAVLLLWLAGTILALGQTLLACAAILRVRRRSKPFAYRELSNRLAQTLGIEHPVDVLETENGSMPMTFGILRPAVFMPSDADTWTEERRRIVLLHELAHVRRGDVATHLLARAALTAYWWNPLAWKAWREFVKERERATDDLVLNAGARASEYANHLLDVARTMHSATNVGCAAVAMARQSQLEGRLMAILDAGVNRRAPRRAAALIAGLLAVALVAPFAAVQAQDSQSRQAIPPDIDAAIQAAHAQKNFKMLEDAAKAARQSGQWDAAQKLLEAALAIHGEVSGPQSVEYGLAVLPVADLQRMRNQPYEGSYRLAIQILGDRPQTRAALIHLGTSALAARDFQVAFDYFQRAQQADPARAGSALMWMGAARERMGAIDEAEALYKQALGVEEPNSGDAATTMRVYAQFLRTQSRTSEAADLDARAGVIQNSRLAPPVSKLAEGVFRAGHGITPPSVLHKVEPSYSEEARLAKVTGSVVLEVVIGTDGVAHNVQVKRGIGIGLDEKAIEAIEQWRFSPGTRINDGEPVAVLVNIEVNFRLL